MYIYILYKHDVLPSSAYIIEPTNIKNFTYDSHSKVIVILTTLV